MCEYSTSQYRAYKRQKTATEDDELNQLYIMSYDFDVHGTQYGYKIGRAADVYERARQLGASHNFKMHIHVIFPNKGHLELQVHNALRDYHVRKGSGTEWFNAPLSVILDAVLRSDGPHMNHVDTQTDE